MSASVAVYPLAPSEAVKVEIPFGPRLTPARNVFEVKRPQDNPLVEAWAFLALMLVAAWAYRTSESVEALPEWQQDTLNRLHRFGLLEDGWDSYDASRITPESIAMTENLLLIVWHSLGDTLGEAVRPYALAPLPYGGVQVEWRGPRGALEVEIDTDGSLSYLLELGQKPKRNFEENEVATVLDVFNALQRIRAS